MQAIHDAGIRYLVSDTSEPEQKNPSPNVGIWNALQPSILEIPRIPADMYFNVSQPGEWIPEWESLKKVATVDYPTMIADQSSTFAGYMLAGNKDPWMFHQANWRNYDNAGHSLLSDLLDATFRQIRRGLDVPGGEPDRGPAGANLHQPASAAELGCVGDDSAGRVDHRRGGQRGDGAGDRASARRVRRATRGRHLVPESVGRAIRDAVAGRLQRGERAAAAERAAPAARRELRAPGERAGRPARMRAERPVTAERPAR